MCAVLAVLLLLACEGLRLKATDVPADEPTVLPAVLFDQRLPSLRIVEVLNSHVRRDRGDSLSGSLPLSPDLLWHHRLCDLDPIPSKP